MRDDLSLGDIDFSFHDRVTRLISRFRTTLGFAKNIISQ